MEAKARREAQTQAAARRSASVVRIMELESKGIRLEREALVSQGGQNTPSFLKKTQTLMNPSHGFGDKVLEMCEKIAVFGAVLGGEVFGLVNYLCSSSCCVSWSSKDLHLEGEASVSRSNRGCVLCLFAAQRTPCVVYTVISH